MVTAKLHKRLVNAPCSVQSCEWVTAFPDFPCKSVTDVIQTIKELVDLDPSYRSIRVLPVRPGWRPDDEFFEAIERRRKYEEPLSNPREKERLLSMKLTGLVFRQYYLTPGDHSFFECLGDVGYWSYLLTKTQDRCKTDRYYDRYTMDASDFGHSRDEEVEEFLSEYGIGWDHDNIQIPKGALLFGKRV